jgi:hypothetical protein
MAPADGGRADLRTGGTGCARLPIRGHRRRARERDRPRSLDGGNCARDAGRCRHDPSQYRRARGVPAGWPDRSSVAAEQADAEPADGRTGKPLPSGRGTAGSTAMGSTFWGESLPTARLQPIPVPRRGPQPGSETPPDGNRHRAEAQPTQLKSRQPAPTRLVGARYRHQRKRKFYDDLAWPEELARSDRDGPR